MIQIDHIRGPYYAAFYNHIAIEFRVEERTAYITESDMQGISLQHLNMLVNAINEFVDKQVFGDPSK